jgi:ubiquinone/menaquinone biosynthesis C-methylase UbiE
MDPSLGEWCNMGRPDSDSEIERQAGEIAPAGIQKNVNAHFDSTVSYWDEVYREEGLQGRIYRNRQDAVLTYIDTTAPRPGSRVMEIGCGAGHLTMQLAGRGLRVEAIDASPAMVELTAERARREGFAESVHVGVADVHALPFADGEFDLIVAVGVLPWLHTPAAAVREMARVLGAGAHLVLTADNGARLTSFIDPREILARTPLRRVYRMLRRRPGVARSRQDFPRRIDRLLRQGGLQPVRRRTVGFGPLSFLRRPIFDDARGVRIDQRLQRLADRGVPAVRWTGWHYVVLARKPLQ